MLKKLFISKVRVSILKTYLLDLNASFHIRQLVRELEEEINAVRRELMNLEDAGILRSKKDGNKLVYTINPKCPVLQELRALFFKQSPIGEKITELGEKINGIQVVLLTESYIKERYENKTDVDLLFIGNMRVRDLSTAVSEIEKELERDIRFSAIKKEDYEFARKKKEPFLMNILEKDKIIMFGELSDLL
jgi:DNA-binding transcriptional ArsR family regulator